MLKPAICILAIMLAACSDTQASRQVPDDRPMRIVSLDYCADQYVLKLVDRQRILAISPDAIKPFSYMRAKAAGMPSVRPMAENVLILKPDLVVRYYGGGPNVAAVFQRAGIPVLQIGWASTIDSDELGSIPTIIQHVAAGLGEPERGAELIAEFRSRLAAIAETSSGKSTLYMTPGGVTSGPGSLVHEMLLAAGLENFQTRPGWHSLPLERLVYEQPDRVAAAFFESFSDQPNTWSAAKHPVARALLTGSDVIPLHGAWTACSGWFILDAIEALAEGAAP